MTIQKLHNITGAIIAKHGGNIDVAIDFRTFEENENGNILAVESAAMIRVQGADDSGPIGKKEPFFVLSGPVDWHAHGDAI